MLGVYFFAMQLITSGVSVFTSAIEEVAFPKLSAVQNDGEAHSVAFSTGMRYSIAGGLLIAMLVFAVAPEFIRYVWSGKWDEAIFAVVVLAAGVPGIISTTFCVAILASKGLWKARLQGLGVLALGDALTAGVVHPDARCRMRGEFRHHRVSV